MEQTLIHEVLKLNIKDGKIKLGNEAVQAVNQVVQSFTLEAIWRAGNQAKIQGTSTVNSDHLEKILPQLVQQIIHNNN